MKQPLIIFQLAVLALLLGCSSKSNEVADFSAEGSSTMIEGVSLNPADGEARLEVFSAAEPKYNVFKLTDPDRIVIDLIDARLSEEAPDRVMGIGNINEVQISEIEDSLSSLVRVEMVLMEPADYVAMVDNGQLNVKVLQDGMMGTDNEAPQGDTFDADSLAVAPPPPIEDQEIMPLEEAPTEESMMGDMGEDADQNAMTNESLDEAPPALEGDAMDSSAEFEFPEAPAPIDELDLVPAPLPVLVDNEASEEEPVEEAEEMPVEEETEMAEMEEPEPTEPEVAEPQVAEEAQVEMPQADTASSVENPTPIIVEPEPSEKAPEPAPLPEQVATQEIPTSGLTTGTSLLTDIETKVYTGRRVSLEFQDADIQDVIRLVAEVSKLNVIVSDDVKGTITLKLVDVPWDQALDIILTAKGLDKVQYGNILRVAPIEQLKKEREIALANDRAAKQLEPLRLKLINVNYAGADEMSARIKNLLSERGSVDTDERTNTLIVRDIRENISRIENLVKVLDTQTPQVRIESRIVQANDNFRRNIGVRWGPTLRLDGSNDQQTDWQFPSTFNIGTAPPGASAFTAPAGEQLSDFAVDALPGSSTGSALGFRVGSVSDVFNLDLQLSYAQTKDMARIISRPSVTVLDNKTARIIQGSKIPFLSSSSEGSNVQFQDAGIEIGVTPQITNDGSVLLQVSTKSNEPGSEAVGGNPIINIREAETEMLVKSGRTAVLGGVFRTTNTESEVGVPGLMDVPVLGWLFKGKSGGRTLEELLIFITPYVLTDAREAVTAPDSGATSLEP